MRALLLILTAQLADLAAFLLAVRALGTDGEVNVVMAAIAVSAGLPAVALVKVVAAIAMAAISSRLPRAWGLVAVVAGLVGAASAIHALA